MFDKSCGQTIPNLHIIKLFFLFVLETYRDFHRWSCDNYSEFWEEVWVFTEIIHSKPYQQASITSP